MHTAIRGSSSENMSRHMFSWSEQGISFQVSHDRRLLEVCSFPSGVHCSTLPYECRNKLPNPGEMEWNFLRVRGLIIRISSKAQLYHGSDLWLAGAPWHI